MWSSKSKLLGASLALSSAFVCVGIALANSSDWSVATDNEFTNVPAGSRSFTYVTAAESPSGRGAHRLTVRMPHHHQPSDRAVVTIERSLSTVGEGDHVTLTYSGDPSETDVSPPPTVAVYVHCVFEDQANNERKKDWQELGIADVQPTTHVTTLRAKIKGSGCVDTVDLGVSREIDGVRIQLRGADRRRDHKRRIAYLYEFKFYDPQTGENNPAVWDDFTKER